MDISEKPEDGGSMFPQNIGKFLSDYMMSHPKRYQMSQDTDNNPALDTLLQK
jgi:hypothetical protein